jgi:hypothetical protein
LHTFLIEHERIRRVDKDDSSAATLIRVLVVATPPGVGRAQ